ncbi:MAG: hypothetical protein PHW75_02080 [Patescibacteria group bacterium]|nr:hypothetical protein [Patescibacteria group bacterium]
MESGENNGDRQNEDTLDKEVRPEGEQLRIDIPSPESEEETPDRQSFNYVSKMQEFLNSKDKGDEKIKDLLLGFCYDFGGSLYEYENTTDENKLKIIEEQQDRVQRILCKIIFDTKAKREKAIEVLGTKVIPGSREELAAAETFENRYKDNEIPREEYRKSGDIKRELRGAEALILLIQNYDDPKVSYSKSRTYREAETENRQYDVSNSEEAKKAKEEELLKRAQYSLSRTRIVQKHGKILNFSIEGEIMEVARRFADIPRVNKNKESSSLDDNYRRGLLKYIRDNVSDEERDAFIKIFRNKEEYQARIIARLTESTYSKELSKKEKDILAKEIINHKILKEALKIIGEAV